MFSKFLKWTYLYWQVGFGPFLVLNIEDQRPFNQWTEMRRINLNGFTKNNPLALIITNTKLQFMGLQAISKQNTLGLSWSNDTNFRLRHVDENLLLFKC